MKRSLLLCVVCATLSGPLPAATDGLTGNWVTPDGAVVAIYPCGAQTVCARLVRPIHRGEKDEKNPDASLRGRSLCGLQVGGEFVLTDSSHAKGGKIYDPDSGKTYSGTMAASESELKLHGYIGISIFGRSEVWHRTLENVATCSP